MGYRADAGEDFLSENIFFGNNRSVFVSYVVMTPAMGAGLVGSCLRMKLSKGRFTREEATRIDGGWWSARSDYGLPAGDLDSFDDDDHDDDEEGREDDDRQEGQEG